MNAILSHLWSMADTKFVREKWKMEQNVLDRCSHMKVGCKPFINIRSRDDAPEHQGMVNTLHEGHHFLDVVENYKKYIFEHHSWDEIDRKIETGFLLDDNNNIHERINKANRLPNDLA